MVFETGRELNCVIIFEYEQPENIFKKKSEIMSFIHELQQEKCSCCYWLFNILTSSYIVWMTFSLQWDNLFMVKFRMYFVIFYHGIEIICQC